MKRVFIHTFGCQMNVNDTMRMSEALSSMAYSPTPTADNADLIILNTCSIREKAEDKMLSALGPVKTASRIDVPRSGAQVSAGRVAVAGVAWAMHRGIQGVQVRVDDGPWADARLAAEPTIDSWRQWVYEWDATPGSHVLTVRARDGAGEWQTDVQTRSDPDGATGHHSVTVRVG